VVHSDEYLTESSNKRRHNLVLAAAAAGKGDSGKHGVETTLTVVSLPFVSRTGEMAD
jgi:hypothetical protein